MENDENTLNEVLEKCGRLAEYLRRTQQMLRTADLSDFITAFDNICADELLPVVRGAKERAQGNYEEYARRLRREYHQAVL